MRKNVASQVVGAQINSKTDGTPVTTGTTTVYVTGDGGTQGTGSVGSGACTHEGHGFWTYAPAQAETNYDHVAFTFENTAGVNATVQIYTSFPQTGDSFARLGAPVGASLSVDVAAVKTDTAAIKTKTDFLPSATAGAAGGVFIAGSNAATSVTTALTANIIGNVTGNLSGSVGSVTGAVGSVTGLTASDVGAIKTKTDFLPSATAGAAGGVFIAGANAATSVTTALTANIIGNVTGNLSGSVGSVTGAVGSVTGAVGSVAAGGIAAASFAAGAINAAAIATDAIDADALAADAVTEIQSGLSTLNAAGVRSAVGLASANLDTQLGAIAGFVDTEVASILAAVDTEVAAIKAKTDQFVFTIANQVDANALSGGSGLDAAGVRAAVGLASANLDTQLDALPTNAELATALGTADDAVLAAVATLQTTADAIPTNAELATALGTADDAVLAAIAALPQDKTGYSLSTAGNAAVADKLLGRNLAGGSDGTRTVQDALRSLRNKTSIAAGTLTVTAEDDTTPAWTAVVTTSPGDPLTSIDPA